MKGKKMLIEMIFLCSNVMEKGEEKILRKGVGEMLKYFPPHFPWIKLRKI